MWIVIVSLLVVALFVYLMSTALTSNQKKNENREDTIRIIKCYHSNVDFVGNTWVYFSFQNLSSKAIKYLFFTVSFYNNVGDLVTRKLCKVVGPIHIDEVHNDGKHWQLYVGGEATKMRLTEVKIEYMDGTSASFLGENLQKINGYHRVLSYGEGNTDTQRALKQWNFSYVFISIIILISIIASAA